MITPNQHYAILMDAALFEIEQGNLNAAKCHLELARYGNPKANGPLIALALAILKIARAIILFILPILLITLYFGGLDFTVKGFKNNILEYIFILVIMIVIKNTNPRVRIDQAVRFFWRIPTIMAILAVVLAYFKY